MPARERELLARLTRVSRGQPPARVVAALYREILSSSRAAQGQAPIGLLQASADVVLPASRSCFGACDEFRPQKTWTALVRGLTTGSLSLALLTEEDLVAALREPRRRTEFASRLAVVGDFSTDPNSKPPPARRIFIVTPRSNRETVPAANRALILIECKSAMNAIKSLLHFMSDSSLFAEHLTGRVRGNKPPALIRLTFPRSLDEAILANRLQAAARSSGLPVSILGIYPDMETYGG